MIIETGELKEETLIKKASQICIEAGADFIKTSTGKVPVNATPEFARMMLEVIRDMGVAKTVGFKPAGGVRTAEDAALYLAMADELLGAEWADNMHYRFAGRENATTHRSITLYILAGRWGGDPLALPIAECALPIQTGCHF